MINISPVKPGGPDPIPGCGPDVSVRAGVGGKNEW